MTPSAFDSAVIQARILREVARIRSKHLDWCANPIEGTLTEKIVQNLVETLDVHAQALLPAVDCRNLIAPYLNRLRSVGQALIQNAEARSLLSDPYSEDRLRKIAESSGEYLVKKHSLTPDQQQQELGILIESTRLALRGKAMEWRIWKSDIVIQIETRFEARLLHWMAEAIEQVARSSKNLCSSTKLQVANWEEIEIDFTSEERVQIRIGKQLETCNYGELGFEDRRSGKPNRAWLLLRVLAAQGGTIREAVRTGEDWPKVEKRIQEIRKSLRNYFRLLDDPLPFVEGTGYRTRFAIRVARSYES